MNHHLEFVDIREGQGTWRRKEDLATFEYSYKAEITHVHALTAMETLYRIRLVDAKERAQFTFRPGQFIMLEIPGIGEAPFSISSSPARHGDLELCIRTAGSLTQYLTRVGRGAFVGIRGPFGTSFPMEKMHDQNLILVAGGLGLAPLRSAIAYVQDNRSRFKRAEIVYGAKDPSQLLFTFQYDMWRADDIGLTVVVEKPDSAWSGATGLVTDVLGKMLDEGEAEFRAQTNAIVCGPPVMFKFVCGMLTKKNIPMQKMFVSLERRMHCGMGKCCRCNVGSTYTCLKGPVFDYWTVMNLKEAI